MNILEFIDKSFNSLYWIPTITKKALDTASHCSFQFFVLDSCDMCSWTREYVCYDAFNSLYWILDFTHDDLPKPKKKTFNSLYWIRVLLCLLCLVLLVFQFFVLDSQGNRGGQKALREASFNSLYWIQDELLDLLAKSKCKTPFNSLYWIRLRLR